jgi:hypothetical protein
MFHVTNLTPPGSDHPTAARYFSHASSHSPLARVVLALARARSPSAMPQLYSVECELGRRRCAASYFVHASTRKSSRRTTSARVASARSACSQWQGRLFQANARV